MNSIDNELNLSASERLRHLCRDVRASLAGSEQNFTEGSIAVAESILAVVSVLVFRRGRWKLKKI